MDPRERPKKPVKINVPPDVYKWLRELEFESSASKTRLGIASFAALCTYNDEGRRKLLQWATLLDEEKVTWLEFTQALKKKQKDRDAAHKAVVDRVLRHEIEEPPSRRRSQRPEAS